MIRQGSSTYKLKDFIVNGNRINARGSNNASGIKADYLINSTIQGNRIAVKGNRSPIQSTNDDGLTVTGNSLVAAGTIAPLVMAGTNATVYRNTGVPETADLAAVYTLTATDSVIPADATSVAFPVTLPTASGVAGRQYTIKRVNSGSNNVTVACSGGQTIDGASTKTLEAQYSAVTLVSDGANWQIVNVVGAVS